MSKFSKIIAITTGIIVTSAGMMMAGNVQAQTCTPSPSCTSLGYNKTALECSEDGIKCPFGDFWFCGKKPVQQPCQIGFIYYADGTCVTPFEHNTSKVALGVVVYVNPDGKGGQVMTINSLGQYSWAGAFLDIPTLTNYESASEAATDFDSCANTDKIVVQGNKDQYQAAWVAKNYAPIPETRGKWCLPSAGVMVSVNNNQGVIQAAIAKLGGTEYPLCCTWTSSEHGVSEVWHSSLYNPFGLGASGKSGTGSADGVSLLYVRPVLEF